MMIHLEIYLIIRFPLSLLYHILRPHIASLPVEENPFCYRMSQCFSLTAYFSLREHMLEDCSVVCVLGRLSFAINILNNIQVFQAFFFLRNRPLGWTVHFLLNMCHIFLHRYYRIEPYSNRTHRVLHQ